MTISGLPSNMTREAALKRLVPSGAPGVLHRWMTGKLHAVAEVYLPYRLYNVAIADRRLRNTRYYAIDAATGMLDPYEFAAPPALENFVEENNRNCHPVLLNETRTSQLAIERVRRSLFSTGFFRLKHPSIVANLVRNEFYIPYWLGFYGDEGNLRLAVLNGVRQTYEGSKVRRLIGNWLADHQETGSMPFVARS